MCFMIYIYIYTETLDFQIQTVCFDNLGLLLAAILNVLLKNSERSFLLSLLFSCDVFISDT